MRFDDSNTSGPASTRDWAIRANRETDEFFAIIDEGADNEVFRIQPNAPDNSLFIETGGNVGMGTSLPTEELHIVAANTPTTRLESTSDMPVWDIFGNDDGFNVRNVVNGSPFFPFAVDVGAPTNALYVANDGDIGLGTQAPNAPLGMLCTGNFNFFRITAEGAAVNKNVDIVFTGGPMGTGHLRYNIVEAGDSPQVPEMTLDAAGNMTLIGTPTTTGSTCTGGCDRVFDPDYDLAGIDARLDSTIAAGNLPAIGPIHPNERVNISETLGNVINELEHAHLYIGQLHEALQAEQSRNDDQAQLITHIMSRLHALDDS